MVFDQKGDEQVGSVVLVLNQQFLKKVVGEDYNLSGSAVSQLKSA